VTSSGTRYQRNVPHAREIIATVALVAIACIAFTPGLIGPYLWDDKALIPGNPAVREMNVRAWFTRDFWDIGGDLVQLAERLRYWRPLVTASYAIDFHLGKGDPFVLHVTNLIAHAIVAALAFFTLRRWTSTVLPAIVGALFFALHPTKAESVAWISGRTDVLCALAILVASVGVSRRLRGLRGGLPLEILGTAVAYMTKEGALVLPAFVAVETWVNLGRPPLDRSVVRRLIVTAAPQVGVAVAYLAARAVWMPVRPMKPTTPLVDHAQMFLESIGRYVALAIAPVNLSSQHGLLRSVDGRLLHATPYVALGAVALVAVTALAVAMRKRAPVVTIALAMFGVLILPVSNLMLTGMSTLVAERFLYLPILAIAWLVAEGAARIGPQRAAVALVAIVFGPLSFARAIDFSDEGLFWTRERARHPESLEAHRVLMVRARDDRRYREAMQHALDGREQAARFYQHRGSEAEFIHHYLELRAVLTPDRDVERLTAIDGFFRALLDPGAQVAEVHAPGLSVSMPLNGPMGNRARALRTRTNVVLAELASRLGRDDDARVFAEQARTACPTCVQAVNVAALVAARRGDYASAYRLLDEIARLRGEEGVAVLRKNLAAAEVAGRQATIADGPIALNLRATELARLELYGRAYDVLLPHRAQIELAPGFAIGFAELAYRAGDEAAAREVLAKHVPAERIGPMLDEWATKMGWR